MSKLEIVRAWKDTAYRSQLSSEEQTLVPEHPAGSIELADEEMEQIWGGDPTAAHFSAGCVHTGCALTYLIAYTIWNNMVLGM